MNRKKLIMLCVLLFMSLQIFCLKTEAKKAYPQNPLHHHTDLNDGSDYTDWNYVFLGSYPQKEVADPVLKAKIDSELMKSGKKTGDVWVEGNKYRKIKKADCNCNESFGNDTYRYFKWTRIKWRVLSNDGERLFLMADAGLDCEEYNEELTNVTWETSTIRKWLNDYNGYADLDRKDSFAAEGFLTTAFTSSEADKIIQTRIENRNNPAYGTDGGNDTLDKIFLLSLEEIENEEYGFCTDPECHSVSRFCKPSEYARAVGSKTRNVEELYHNNFWWWLRSVGEKENFGTCAGWDGTSNRKGDCVDFYDGTIVPALYLQLDSGWYKNDDGTSGYGGEDEREHLLKEAKVTLDNHSIILGKNTKAVLLPTIEPVSLKDELVLSWHSGDEAVATVADGIVKAVGIGTTEITVELFNGKKDFCKVTVTNGMQIPQSSYTTEETQSGRDVKKGQMIADQASNGNYVITSDTSESPAAEYIGAIDGTKSSIKIPQSVYYQGLWYEVTSIKTGALKGNKNIKTVTIGKFVTKIGDNAFSGCVKLKKVTIGAGVQTIGKNAFKGCKSLTKLTLKTTILKKVGSSALKGIHEKCRIKVPKVKLKEYQKLFKKKGQKATVKITK